MELRNRFKTSRVHIKRKILRIKQSYWQDSDNTKAFLVFAFILLALSFLFLYSINFSLKKAFKPSNISVISNIFVAAVAVTTLYIGSRRYLLQKSHDIGTKYLFEDKPEQIKVVNLSRNPVVIDSVEYFAMFDIRDETFEMDHKRDEVLEPLDTASQKIIDLDRSLVFFEFTRINYTTSTGESRSYSRTYSDTPKLGNMKYWSKIKLLFQLFIQNYSRMNCHVDKKKIEDLSEDDIEKLVKETGGLPGSLLETPSFQ